jgi:site-specific recombinase XerD
MMSEQLIEIPIPGRVTVYQEPLCNDGSTIEDLITSFVKAKFARTQSTKTAKAYQDTLHNFRRHLQAQGLDLVASLKGKTVDEMERFRIQVAEAAHDFAILSARLGRFVAKSTWNQRLAIISSFYTYAAQNLKISCTNPLDLVEQIQSHLAKLAAKEPKTVADKRDLALLTVLFFTGRRVSEVATLRHRHLHIGRSAGAEIVTLTFARMKQGKHLVSPLNARASALLLDYLRS